MLGMGHALSKITMRSSRLAPAIITLALGSACAEVASSNDEGPATPPTSTNVVGKYSLASTFDLDQGMPGKVGDITRAFLTITDGPDAPARGLWELVIASLDSQGMRDAAMQARDLTVAKLNERLEALAPELIPVLLDLGEGIQSMTTDFRTVSELDIRAVPQGQGVPPKLIGKHKFTGVAFDLGGEEQTLAFRDLNVPEVTVDQVPVNFSGIKITLGQHRAPMPAGVVLRAAIDRVLLPATLPGAANLGEAFEELIDCQDVGNLLADTTGYGYADAFAEGCHFALIELGELVYERLLEMDASSMVLQLTGDVRGRDDNKDGRLDALTTGKWYGKLDLSGELGAAPGTFTGKRM